MYIFCPLICILYVYYLREFGFQTSVISAPLRWVPWLFLRFRSRDLPAFTSLKRYVFQALIRLPTARSHLKRFWLEFVISFGSGAHVLSRPRFFSSGSRLGTREPKSLHFYSTFFAHIPKTIVNIDSKSKLCPSICHFELLAAVL
jgi:hypothetical protein